MKSKSVATAMFFYLSAFVAAISAPTSWARTASDIVNRPNREAEEKAAWNPEPISWEEFLNPSIPLKENYPTRVMPTRGYWMDNRYVMAWSGGPKVLPPNEKRRAFLGILDTDTAEVFEYKEGFLHCYRDGQIVFDYVQRDSSAVILGGRRFQGKLDAEIEVLWGVESPSGRTLENPIGLRECRNGTRDDENVIRAKEIFGTMPNPDPIEKIRTPNIPVRTYEPLLPQHGYFSRDIAKIISIKASGGTPKEVQWVAQNGAKTHFTDISLTYEIGGVISDNFAPFLRLYAFDGGAINYSESPRAVTSGNPDWWRIGKTFRVVVFNPNDGSIQRISRPKWLLQNAQTMAVRLTRAGSLWIGGVKTPGLFLSRGEEVKKIFDYHVGPGNLKISPNGCRILFMHEFKGAPMPTRLSGPLGAIFDFTPNSSPLQHLIIDLCESK